MNILEKIVAQKKEQVVNGKALVPIKKLEDSLYYDTPSISLSNYIKRSDKDGIIAEFKRRSPSKPAINLYADPKPVSIGYMQAGASALSVLTDGPNFGGSHEDLVIARSYNYSPILRKDFIIDEYQIIEAKSIGADAILLIAEILDKEQVNNLSSFAHSIGMEVLLELHSEKEIDKIGSHIDVIGVNNRDLKTFKTDINHSLDMVNALPKEITKISESGIKTPEQAFSLHQAGFNGFLIGELFMKHHSPQQACSDFIQSLKRLKKC